MEKWAQTPEMTMLNPKSDPLHDPYFPLRYSRAISSLSVKSKWSLNESALTATMEEFLSSIQDYKSRIV